MTERPDRADDRGELVTRLDLSEARLAGLSRMPYPSGRTDGDPGGEEAWDAARVWAHIAEFVPYWTAQARGIVESPPGIVPPCGRLATDPGRIEAIERDRLLPRERLWSHVHDGIEAARAWFLSISAHDLDRVGQHPVRGPVPARFILEQFIVKHLEEHADQLEELAGTTQPPTLG